MKLPSYSMQLHVNPNVRLRFKLLRVPLSCVPVFMSIAMIWVDMIQLIFAKKPVIGKWPKAVNSLQKQQKIHYLENLQQPHHLLSSMDKQSKLYVLMYHIKMEQLSSNVTTNMLQMSRFNLMSSQLKQTGVHLTLSTNQDLCQVGHQVVRTGSWIAHYLKRSFLTPAGVLPSD